MRGKTGSDKGSITCFVYTTYLLFWVEEKYEAKIKKADVKVRVVERWKRSLKNILQKSDPLKSKNSQTPISARCALQEIKKSVEIECAEYRHVYIWETARNA